MTARIGQFRFVVFSDDWGRHPSSSQHLFRRIVPHARVLWVHTVGIRSPGLRAYDARRAVEVVSGWMVREKTPGEAGNGKIAPKILRPVMIPSFRPALVSDLNQVLLRRVVQKALLAEGEEKPTVLVSTVPSVPGLFESELFVRKVYYCVDDFASWPGVAGTTMKRLEHRILEACDVLIATSRELLRDRGKGRKRSALLTHGVDLEHFARARVLEPPAGLAALPRPVIGMFGVFDDRIDGDLLTRLARTFSGGSIVVLGPVDRSTAPFLPLGNVHFPGKVSYEDLPSHAAAFDACILPYRTHEAACSLNPLKLKEYLATGKPVVATPLPEALDLRPHITVAGRDDFCGAVRTALGRKGVSAGLADFLSGESWEKKAETFLEIALDGL